MRERDLAALETETLSRSAQKGILATVDVPRLDGFLTTTAIDPADLAPNLWEKHVNAAFGTDNKPESERRPKIAVKERCQTKISALGHGDTFIPALFNVLKPEQIQGWAQGFLLATEILKGAWPTKMLTQKDKAALRMLKDLAAGKKIRRPSMRTLSAFVNRWVRFLPEE